MEPLPFARAPVIKEGLLCAYCLWRTLRPLWPLHLAPVSPLTPLLSLFARRIFARRHRPRSQAWRRRRRARQLEGPLLRAVGPLVLLRVQERACRRGARGAARTAPREGARRLRAHSRRTHARCFCCCCCARRTTRRKKRRWAVWCCAPTIARGRPPMPRCLETRCGPSTRRVRRSRREEHLLPLPLLAAGRRRRLSPSAQAFEFTIHAFPKGMTLRARSHSEVDAWVSGPAEVARGRARSIHAHARPPLIFSPLLAASQLAALMKPLADAGVPYNGWERRGGAVAAGAGR